MPVNVPLAEPLLVVLVGPPGSGKTTWARRHGQGAVHVSQDDLIDAITPHGFEYIYRPIYAAAEAAIARTALAAGHTVIVDRTNRTRALRERWLRIARAAGCPVVAVVMTADRSLCEERNRARTGPRRVSDDRMERMLAAMEPVALDEGFAATFDGDAVTLAGILARLKPGRKESGHEYCHEAR